MEPMTAFPWIDVATILALVALNGLFAMSELAIVSARNPRLQALEKAGRRGARTAPDLPSDQGKFLSTVQIGTTLNGILAAHYSGPIPARTPVGVGKGVVRHEAPGPC